MTGDHRDYDDHRPGPACWIAMIVGGFLACVAIGAWQMWGGR